MLNMWVTFETSQSLRSRLKEVAKENMSSMWVTFETSHPETFPLKAAAPCRT